MDLEQMRKDNNSIYHEKLHGTVNLMNWDIIRECKNENPRDKTEGWNLIQLKRDKREKKKELTTQRSRELKELSEARGLTQGT